MSVKPTEAVQLGRYRVLSIYVAMVDRLLTTLEPLDTASSMPFVANLTPGAAAVLFQGGGALASQRFVLIYVEDDSRYAFNTLGLPTELEVLRKLVPQLFSTIKRRQIVSVELGPDALQFIKSEPKRTTAVI